MPGLAVPVVNGLGAGDAFGAAFGAGLLAGMPLVEAIRRGWPDLPILIIVSDEPSYIEAIARWTIHARYPVLLDDGTEAAREDIARFARAYSPKSILRWSSGASFFVR